MSRWCEYFPGLLLLLTHVLRCHCTTTADSVTEPLTTTTKSIMLTTDTVTDTQTTSRQAADARSTTADLTARRPTHILFDWEACCDLDF